MVSRNCLNALSVTVLGTIKALHSPPICGTDTLSIVCCSLPSPRLLGDVQGMYFISCLIMANLLVIDLVTC